MKPGAAQRFAMVCQPYAPMVYRHCLHMLKNPQEAEDAAQESLLRAFRAFDTCREDGVASWLYRIAHNTCLDVLKSSRIKRETALTDETGQTLKDQSPTPEDAYITSSEKDKLWAQVEKLPLEQQTLLSLYYGEGMRYQELSRALSLPEGTIKSRLNRAKEALRKGWTEHE